MRVRILAVLVLLSFSAFSQKKKEPLPDKPKLVVGIIVDQMRYEYLYRFYSRYSDKGLKRLMNEGFNCRNNHYHYASTITGPGHAHVYTGSVPAITGIVGNDWYERSLKKSMYVVSDSTVSIVGEGNPNAGKMSPKNLKATTITDQLRIASQFKSKVVGVAFKDRGAILPAGHTGSAYWFDTKNANWITSTYYTKELPKWVKDFNDRKLPESYTKLPWETLYPIDTYTASEGDDQPYESLIAGDVKPVFPHKVTIGSLASTPFGNNLTKEFAIAAIEAEQLGRGEATDFLAVSFSSTDYVGHAFGPQSKEIEDVYLRFDKDIEDLLTHLDKTVGAGKYTVFLSADHAVAEVPAFLKKHNVPSGLFVGGELEKFANAAISSVLGEGKWVTTEDNYQLYMNDALLTEKKVTIPQIVDILRTKGIEHEGIYNIVDLRNANMHSVPQYFREKIINVYNPKRSGDIMILPEPAWMAGYVKGTTHGTMYNYDTHAPLLWFGWGINKGETTQPTYISDIAPTLAMLLKILEPNGSVGKPIQEVLKK